MEKRKDTQYRVIGHGAILAENHKAFEPFAAASSEYRKSVIGDNGGYCSRIEMNNFISGQKEYSE